MVAFGQMRKFRLPLAPEQIGRFFITLLTDAAYVSPVTVFLPLNRGVICQEEGADELA
jgi:hypothetical protein